MKLLLLPFVFVVFVANVYGQQNGEEFLFKINGEEFYSSQIEKENLWYLERKGVEATIDSIVGHRVMFKKALDLDLGDNEYDKTAKLRESPTTNLLKDKIRRQILRDGYKRINYPRLASVFYVKITNKYNINDTLRAYKLANKYRRELILKKATMESIVSKTKENGSFYKRTVKGFDYPFALEDAIFKKRVDEYTSIIRLENAYAVAKIHEEQVDFFDLIYEKHSIEKTEETERRMNREFLKDSIVQLEYAKVKLLFSDEEIKVEKINQAEVTAPFELISLKVGETSSLLESSTQWYVYRLLKKERRAMLKESEMLNQPNVTNKISEKLYQYAINVKSVELNRKAINQVKKLVKKDFFNRKGLIEISSLAENRIVYSVGESRYTQEEYIKDLNQIKETLPEGVDNSVVLSKVLIDAKKKLVLSNYEKEALSFSKKGEGKYKERYIQSMVSAYKKNLAKKAKSDIEAQQKYFEEHQREFWWKERIEADIYGCATKEIAQEVLALVVNRKTKAQIFKKYQRLTTSAGKPTVKIYDDLLEKDNTLFPYGMNFKEGVKMFDVLGGETYVILVKGRVPQVKMTFEESLPTLLPKFNDMYAKEYVRKDIKDSDFVLNEVEKKKLQQIFKD